MENILAITFDENQNAYEALTKLNELDDQEQVGLSGAAVVERKDDGTIDIKDEVGDVGWEGTATGGVLGLLIGVIGGPLGILLGGATGLLYGSLFDLADSDETESVLTDVARTVTVGQLTLLAQVSEENPGDCRRRSRAAGRHRRPAAPRRGRGRDRRRRGCAARGEGGGAQEAPR